MKKIGIVSYNIYGNFTNYGSALQSWALHQAVERLGAHPVLVDYCPDILRDKDPLNPFSNMWDKDEEARRMCELTMPAIRENYYKFDSFYTNRFDRTEKKYLSDNFDDVVTDEKLSGFICGSDTIFCMDEFGFDQGFYADYVCMQGKTAAYAASFGDPSLTEENCRTLNKLLKNFKAIGLRENMMVPYVAEHTDVEVKQVLDPTLLHTCEVYDHIAVPQRLVEEKYILYYSRRFSPIMEQYVEKLAKENGWKVVEISLRATNAEKGHRMYYEAGVEEFLSLVKNAEFVVTNSFHGIIFAMQYRRPFVIFSREQCNTKIEELLQFTGLTNRIMVSGNEMIPSKIDYDAVHEKIAEKRLESMEFLRKELAIL